MIDPSLQVKFPVDTTIHMMALNLQVVVFYFFQQTQYADDYNRLRRIQQMQVVISTHLAYGIFSHLYMNLCRSTETSPIDMNIKAHVHKCELRREKTCLYCVENKDADQPAHPRSLISVIVIHVFDSFITLLSP